MRRQDEAKEGSRKLIDSENYIHVCFTHELLCIMFTIGERRQQVDMLGVVC